jgi:elongation factor G
MSDSLKSAPLGRIRNIGIIAHIDAGKTTTSERILYYSGKEHRMGEVHDGSAVMDYMQDEQERGITITSAATTFYWREHQVNLIDTPGHVDFTAEVERSLRVLDGAVLVFCGVGGVEAQSETVWHQAERYHVPCLAFINKLDRAGAGVEHVLDDMRKRLGANPLLVQIPVGLEDKFVGVIDLVEMKQYTFDEESLGETVIESEIPAGLLADAEVARAHLLETVVEADDVLMEKYLAEEELTPDEIRSCIRALTLSRKVVPVLCGSSLRNKGVQPLLDAVVYFLPSPKDVPPMVGHDPKDENTKIECQPLRKEPLAALAFKVIEDDHGALTFIRVYSGEIKEGERVIVAHSGRKERASRLHRMHANHRTREELIGPGEIVAVTGFKFATTGDTICAEGRLVELEPPKFPATVISMAIEPRTNDAREKLMDVLAKLCREDPTFRYKTDDETGQLVVSGMGELHLDIIRTRITRDYKVEANTGTPRVTYRESIAGRGRGTGVYEQTIGGRNHYAEVTVEIEPCADCAEPVAKNRTNALQIPEQYVPIVENAVVSGCMSGPLGGYPLIHLKATVVDGKTRENDASELAFAAAAENALRQAVEQAGASLMEPVMAFEVTTPEEYLGGIIHDMNGRRAEIGEIGNRGLLRLVRGKVPLAEMFGYATAVRGLSTGRASFTMEPCAYVAVPRRKFAEILGYDPAQAAGIM